MKAEITHNTNAKLPTWLGHVMAVLVAHKGKRFCTIDGLQTQMPPIITHT
tara:strand:- start:556 stop:705 length:150 start_codon:yes stop_codon:yes gene_type:complete